MQASYGEGVANHTGPELAERVQAPVAYDFQGKVALVTGAGSGIGRATALAFARHGGRVIEVRASSLRSGGLWDYRSQRVWGFDIVAETAKATYEQAGVGPREIDVFEVHDAFTIGELVTTEALGLCGEGEAADLVAHGHTWLGGKQPVNPSGGLLSRGHPLGCTGVAQLAELVWQLRGEAGQRQVDGARLGLVETMGGGAAGIDGNACVVSILGR